MLILSYKYLGTYKCHQFHKSNFFHGVVILKRNTDMILEENFQKITQCEIVVFLLDRFWQPRVKAVPTINFRTLFIPPPFVEFKHTYIENLGGKWTTRQYVQWTRSATRWSTFVDHKICSMTASNLQVKCSRSKNLVIP